MAGEGGPSSPPAELAIASTPADLAAAFIADAARLRAGLERVAMARAALQVAAATMLAAWAAVLGVLRWSWSLPLAAAWTFAAMAMATALAWAWRRPERRRDDGAWMAVQRVNAGDRAGAERLRTTWELLRGDVDAAFAIGLLREASPAWQALREQGRRRRRRRAIEAALAAVVALAGGLQAIGAWADVERARAQVARRPVGPRALASLVDDLQLYVEPPAYARAALGAQDEAGDDAGVMQGSLVRVSVLPRADVRALEVEVERAGQRERQAVGPAPGGRLQFALVVEEATSYRFFGRDAAETVLYERGARALTPRPDAAPEALLEEPVGEMEVRAGGSVVFAGRVADDIGVSAIDLVVAGPSGGVERRAVALTRGERRVAVRESVEVDRLGLRAGEIATVTLEAADVAGEGAPRRGRSAPVTLRMFSPDRFHAKLLDRLGLQALAWTLALAERLEGDPQVATLGPAEVFAAQAAFASQEAGLLGDLEALRGDLADDVLMRAATRADVEAFDRLLRDRGDEEARAVQRLQAELATAAADTDGRQQRRDRARLGRLHGRVVDAIERTVLGLAALAMAEHRNALVRDGKALAELEAQLAAVLKRLKERPDDVGLRAEAERLLDAIGQRVEQMRAEAGRQLQLLPPERLNQSAVEPSELEGALGDRRDALDKVREALRAGKIGDALAAFEASRGRLSAAMEALQAEAEAERTGEDAALERLLGELRRGVDEVREGEAELREAARPAAEAQERQTAEALQRSLHQQLPRVRALLDDARDQLRPKRLSTQEMRASTGLADARASLSQAAADMARGDIDAALLALLEAADSLDAARRQLLQREAAPETDEAQLGALGKDRGRVELAQDRAGRAAAQLRQLLPRPESMHDAATRRRLATLGQRQERVRRQLERVRQRLAQQATVQPGLERQVGGRLDHAEQMMRQAGAALGESDATRGARRMAEASAALDAAQQMLQRASGPSTAGPGEGEARVGRRSDAGALPLPDKRAGEAGEDFRKRVQDAARREAPAGWSERVQRYWLRLGE